MANKFKTGFKEVKALGSGAFSTVFEAKSIKNKKSYAIKKIPFTVDEKDKTLKEINILRALKSDFIVLFVDWWIENNYYIGSFEVENQQNISSSNLLYSPNKPLLLHIQMELCSITLDSFIKQMNFSKQNSITNEQYGSVCDIFIQILECVQYLHSHKPPIIHRDLKPDNIMLITNENGYKVKVTDFGLSTYHNYVDQSHTKYVGTKTYRAPEVEKKKKYDTKADIYSLGTIMENLFNFDLESDTNEINFEIQSYYENAKQICLKCVSYTANQRPECHEILKESQSWSFRNNHTKRLSENINKRLINILRNEFSGFNQIRSKLLYSCKQIAIIEEVEEKFIFEINDRKIYALRVNEHYDTLGDEPVLINELINKEIQTIVSGREHVLCLTKDKKVYSFGDNSYSQLGRGGNFFSDNKPSIIKKLTDKRIIDVKCGANHSLALSESGRVFAWGSGGNGQNGNGINDIVNTPIELKSLCSEKIISISCGYVHNLALSQSGKLYGWGDNESGELGIGNNCNQNKPIIIEFEDTFKIKKICCGRYHSLVLSVDNNIYSFGWNIYGQLGIGNNVEQIRPIKVQTTIKFIDIESTFNHDISIGLSTDKIYYVWGKCGKESQHTPTQTNFNSLYEFYNSIDYKVFPSIFNKDSFFQSWFINKLNEMNSFKRLNQQIIANMRSLSIVRLKEIKAILVTNDDIVYTYRLNKGIDSFSNEPTIVNKMSNMRIKSIICGSEHILYLNEMYEVYSFGNNSDGQLGNGSLTLNYKPSIIKKLNNKKIIDISCGANHCLALSKLGKIFMWGSGYYGQSGNGDVVFQVVPTKIQSLISSKIISISCGANHCLALSSNNELYGWGRNEFGQLGIGNNTNQTKPILIGNPHKIVITKISCGRSHSLLLTNDRKLYSFGCNINGQLGIGNIKNQYKMNRIKISTKFIDISTNWCNNISAGLSQTGKYYIWGKCGIESINIPRETDLTSFDEIFVFYRACLLKQLDLYQKVVNTK